MLVMIISCTGVTITYTLKGGRCKCMSVFTVEQKQYRGIRTSRLRTTGLKVNELFMLALVIRAVQGSRMRSHVAKKVM